MTNSNEAHIIMVIDRSGSMAAIKGDAEGGIRTFLDEQRKLIKPGEFAVTVSLAWFDNEFGWHCRASHPEVAATYTLTPRGSTALLDAMGRAIQEEGERLRSLTEDQRPGKVVCVVVTDGYENASREWTQDQIKALVEQQKTSYNWQFVFLAADPTTIAMGQHLGTGTVHYAATSAGTRRAYGVTGQSVSDYLIGNTSTVDTPEDVR